MEDDKTAIRRPKAIGGSDELNACLIVLSGESIGQLFKLTEQKCVIGRAPEAGIRLEDKGVSRHHAQLIRYEEGVFMLKDMNSTNGTFVNGQQIKSRVLNDGDRIQIGSVTILKFSLQDSLEDQFQEQLYNSATRDALTQTYNKRFFDELLSKEFSHAVRRRSPLSILLLDLDHFKNINDTHGHLAGDAILREVSALLMNSLRNEDVMCRIGGEEFAIILRDTRTQDACILAERLRALVEAKELSYESVHIPLTISVGVAGFAREKHPRPDALVSEADRYLYDAKHGGRNRVVSGDDC